MISAALEFIHARKWLMELILLGVIVAAVAYWHHATFEAGIQHQKDEDAKELAAAIADRDRLAAERQANAERRSADLKTALDGKQAELDEIRKHLPTHAVKHDETSTDSCPPLRLDTDWVRTYQATSDASASTVLHP